MIKTVDGASGVAEHAVDAHAVLLVDVELLGRLQVLAFGERLFFVADEPGLHALELTHEISHGNDQIADHGKIAQRLDAYGSGSVVGQKSGPSKVRLAVYEHAAASADAHAARPAIGERAVLFILDIVKRVEDHPILAERDLEGFEIRGRVLLRRVTRDFEMDGVGHSVLTRAGFLRWLSVNSFAWRPARDFDGKIVHAGAAVAGARDQGVREEFFVVALGKIGALVCAAGLLTLQGGV